MIARYTRPEMGALFTDQFKYETWLKVELAVCKAWAERGEIPRDAHQRIQKKARFDVAEIDRIEAEVQHDVIAFTTSVAKYIGADSAWFHRGLTSSDVVDTAQSMVLKQAGRQIEDGLGKLRKIMGQLALEHRRTACIGRTHGVHAEPTTFGLKLLVFYEELGRHEERLAAAIEEISVGKLSGAVGNFANIPPQIEEQVLRELALRPEPVSNQIVQRDRHASFICTLANLGATMEKIAVNLRTYQRTEIGEIQEPFGKGQKGSSAMPHKKNPILLERITGLARVLRGYSVTALEDVALWDERDISHSGAERVILPDACIAADYMLAKLTHVVEHMEVRSERMKNNVMFTKGLVFSQRVLLTLTEAGMSREDAYLLVQRNAMRCWDEGIPLLDLLLRDPEVRKVLTPAQISAAFNLEPFFENVDYIFQRVGLLKGTAATAAPRTAAKRAPARSGRPPARRTPTSHSAVTGGAVQNITENPEHYYEQTPITSNRPPVIDTVDETLGEAEHQKKRVRGEEAAPAAKRPRSPRSTAERAPARRSAAKTAPEAVPATVAEPAAPADGTAADDTAVKKRRRRGTRGGRRKRGGGGTAGTENGNGNGNEPAEE